jgi:hypothetical protein
MELLKKSSLTTTPARTKPFGRVQKEGAPLSHFAAIYLKGDLLYHI